MADMDRRDFLRRTGLALVQPASVDLRLGDSFRVFHNHRTTAIDLRQPPINLTEEVIAGEATDVTLRAAATVEGVIEAKVTWEPKEAVVTYDDAKTTPAALTKATENAGYPSTVKK